MEESVFSNNIMKIGIVTYVRTDNYGAELQGYALQRFLNKKGHDAEVLDFDKVGIDSETFRYMAKQAVLRRLKSNPMRGGAELIRIAAKIFKSRLFPKAVQLIEQERKKSREAVFTEFWMNSIRHSAYIPLEELKTKKLDYDVLIAGSDQIWNYTRTSYLDPYFLKFGPDNIRRLSYAASFSVKIIPEHRVRQYTNLINNIDIISVREVEGVRIVKDLTGREAKVVLDPTLLLDREEWMKVASSRIKVVEPYILTYSLNSSLEYWKIVYNCAKKKQSESGESPA